MGFKKGFAFVLRKRNPQASGFTLIEILIVLAIIVILTTTLISVVNPTKQIAKARDVKRMENLRQIRQVLLFYLLDKEKFPETSEYGENETGLGSGTEAWDTSFRDQDNDQIRWLDFLLEEKYAQSIPRDPLNCSPFVTFCGGIQNQAFYRYYRYDANAGCQRPFVILQAVRMEVEENQGKGEFTCVSCPGCEFLDYLDQGYTLQIFE